MTSIATSADGESLPIRGVAYSPALGSQVTTVMLLDPTGDDPTVGYTYDQYGQPWKVTDELGRVTRTETDGRGNALAVVEEDDSGTILRENRAAYDEDHVVRTEDEAGNASTFDYDDSWRLLSATQVVSEELSDGGVVGRQTYDEYGRLITQALPSSTSYNLLRNGTFHLDPGISGNGWDGTPAGAVLWDNYSAIDYLGGKVMVLGGTGATSYITSDEVSVRADRDYSLSAWVMHWGKLRVLEYDTSHQPIGTVDALVTASHASAFRRTSVAYRPSSSASLTSGSSRTPHLQAASTLTTSGSRWRRWRRRTPSSKTSRWSRSSLAFLEHGCDVAPI